MLPLVIILGILIGFLLFSLVAIVASTLSILGFITFLIVALPLGALGGSIYGIIVAVEAGQATESTGTITTAD